MYVCACVCKHVTNELSLGNALGMWSGRFLHSASIYPRLPLNPALGSPNAKPEGVYDSSGKKKKGYLSVVCSFVVSHGRGKLFSAHNMTVMFLRTLPSTVEAK